MESFQQLQSLGELFDLGFAVSIWNFFTQVLNFAFQIDVFHQFLDRFCTHLGVEFVAEFFHCFEILLVVQQLATLKRGHARLSHHVRFEVQNAFDVAQGHVEQQADAAWQGLQEPDVSNRARQLDVSHAFTTHFRQSNFNAALLTDNSAVLHALVFATQAFVIFYWAKNFGTEETFTFGLERTIVDGLWLFNFAKGP